MWPAGLAPLRGGGARPAARTPGTLPADYPFVRVEGDGVHEIAVGPVHAGIIEPGHFRFSVVGEKVLRLEQHLGYVHKGIERRFTELAPLDAHRLAGRVSGDSTVAYAWAYCMALESAWHCEIPERAQWLRALMLERESASPTTWATWARWATTPLSPSAWRSSRACARTGSACRPTSLATAS